MYLVLYHFFFELSILHKIWPTDDFHEFFNSNYARKIYNEIEPCFFFTNFTKTTTIHIIH